MIAACVLEIRMGFLQPPQKLAQIQSPLSTNQSIARKEKTAPERVFTSIGDFCSKLYERQTQNIQYMLGCLTLATILH